MFNHNWLKSLPALIWFLTCCCCCLNSGVYGQSENAIGAHRVFEKTSFSCSGRPAGYYADVETGCQVYHMCDGLGRQFSYSCPNTTLFQQRMLICDHWYMVNCSKAESHYAANLLIGQRDKPFVNDEESNLRTPRPDLLDRPYAPDYSGESFRNQYKQIPPVQNQIIDNNAQKNVGKGPQVQLTAPGQTRWKILQPSRIILPPAYEPQIEEQTSTAKAQTQRPNLNSVRTSSPTIPTQTASRRQSFKSSTRKPITTTVAIKLPNRKESYSIGTYNNAALHQRQQESVHDEQEDLGTSHSTRYNTSADFNSAEAPGKPFNSLKTTFASTTKVKTTTIATATPSTTISKPKPTKAPIKVPSKFYEPPFLYPIYNQDDETISTETPLIVSTAAPFTAPQTTRSPPPTKKATTIAPSRPTTQAGKPFTVANRGIASTTPAAATRKQSALVQNQRFVGQKKDIGILPSAQGFKPPTPRPPVSTTKTPQTTTVQQKIESSPFDYKVPTTSRLELPTLIKDSDATGIPQSPAKELLPPFQDFVQHDVATTQGPPIYYEWKIPSNGLEPPKLDPPIGVDGREYPEAIIDYNTISSTGSFSSPPTFGIDQLKPDATSENSFGNNGFLSSNPTNEVVTTRTPSSRSIKETAQPNSINVKTNKKSPTQNPTTVAPLKPGEETTDITRLRKELSVPDYLFPLESIGRTGYLAADTYNSFQLKIPERRSDEDVEQLRWFGENPRCPECHPSFVVPGTCAPCFKR